MCDLLTVATNGSVRMAMISQAAQPMPRYSDRGSTCDIVELMGVASYNELSGAMDNESSVSLSLKHFLRTLRFCSVLRLKLW